MACKSKQGKSVLLAGSSYSAAPLLFRLKQWGYQVAVCGNIEDDPCHAYADRSFPINYADAQALATLAKKEQFDYVVPTCNDASYQSSAWAAEDHGFPGFDPHETTTLLHQKNRFREFAQKHGFPAPRAVEVTPGQPPDLTVLTFPCLVKPVDNFSGRGIQKISQPAQLESALAHAWDHSPSQAAVVEEFKEGPLFSHSAFLAHGDITADFFADEYCTVYPYQVNCSSLASQLDGKTRAGMRECIRDLAATLHLDAGLIHTQFILNHGDPWLIECMRRCPGDLYYILVEAATGFDYTSHYLAPFVDRPAPAPTPQAPRHIARHTLSSPHAIPFRSYQIHLNVRQYAEYPLLPSGHLLQPAPFGKAGILFLEFDNKNELAAHTPVLQQHITLHSLTPPPCPSPAKN